VITEDFEEMEEVSGKQIFFVPIWKWFLGGGWKTGLCGEDKDICGGYIHIIVIILCA